MLVAEKDDTFLIAVCHCVQPARFPCFGNQPVELIQNFCIKPVALNLCLQRIGFAVPIKRNLPCPGPVFQVCIIQIFGYILKVQRPVSNRPDPDLKICIHLLKPEYFHIEGIYAVVIGSPFCQVIVVDPVP